MKTSPRRTYCQFSARSLEAREDSMTAASVFSSGAELCATIRGRVWRNDRRRQCSISQVCINRDPHCFFFWRSSEATLSPCNLSPITDKFGNSNAGILAGFWLGRRWGFGLRIASWRWSAKFSEENVSKRVQDDVVGQHVSLLSVTILLTFPATSE